MQSYIATPQPLFNRLREKYQKETRTKAHTSPQVDVLDTTPTSATRENALDRNSTPQVFGTYKCWIAVYKAQHSNLVADVVTSRPERVGLFKCAPAMCIHAKNDF